MEAGPASLNSCRLSVKSTIFVLGPRLESYLNYLGFQAALQGIVRGIVLFDKEGDKSSKRLRGFCPTFEPVVKSGSARLAESQADETGRTFSQLGAT